MASFTMSSSQTFPEGATVTVYPASNWTGLVGAPPVNSAPPGSSTTSGTVSGGSVTFTGLASSTKYWATAVVNSVQTYVGMVTPNVSGGSKTWDPPSTLTGAVAQTTVTTTTVCAVGDSARASFSIALPAGCFLEAEVTAPNTVTVSLVNLSGSTQDVGSGNLFVTTAKNS